MDSPLTDLHLQAIGHDHAIVQIASQFDYRESQTTNDSDVETYLTDRTQDPQGSIEAGAAALHRKAASGVKRSEFC